MAFLRLRRGAFPVKIIELQQPRTLLGRHSSCTVRFDSDVISRHHAQVVEQEGRHFLEDLGSNNGTFLNGVALTAPMELRDGDELQMCSYVFSFHTAALDEASAGTRTPRRRLVDENRTIPEIDQEGWNVPIAGATDSAAQKSTVVVRFAAGPQERDARLGRHAEAKLRAVLSISERLGRPLPVNELFATVLDGLAEIFPQMDQGAVLVQSDSGQLDVQATRDARGKNGVKVAISRTVARAALKQSEAILIEDIEDDSRFGGCESLHQLRIRSMMCVPLLGTDHSCQCVLQIGTQSPAQHFDDSDLDVMTSVAAQVALAVRNARLNGEVLQARRFAESIIATVREALIVLDEHLHVVSANRSFTELFGIPGEAVLGKRFPTGVPGLKPGPRLDRWLRRSMRRGQDAPELEWELDHPDRGRCSLALSARRLENEAAQPALVLVAIRDLTDRKRAEERARALADELAHASRVSLVGEMAAGIAHELHQPLAAVVNYASGCIRRLRQGGVEPLELGESLQEINEQALRAGEIVQCIRRFVQKRNINPEPLDLNRTVADALQLAAFVRRRHGTHIEFRPQSDLPLAYADPIQITQVILNLIVNAIESMTELPESERIVEIETRAAHGLQVSVTDRGRGVPAEIQEKIFEQFYTTKAEGLGIGLAISRSVVEAHGGRLWVESLPGRGATFRFTLPEAVVGANPNTDQKDA